MSKTALFTRSEKLLIAALAFVQFSHIVDFMILMPLGPQLMRIFEITPQQFGLLVSSYTFAAGATGILSAFFIDRFDRKTALMFFYVGFAIGTLACALAEDYVALLMTRTLTGAFGGVLSSLSLSIVSDRINVERRATAMSLLMMAFSAASVIGVPFSLYLATRWDWHAPFTFLGILALLLVGLIHYAVPRMGDHLKGQIRANHFWQPVTAILANPNQLLALGFMILLVFGQFSMIPFLSPSLVINAGLSEAQLPLIYLVGGICSIFSGPLIGRAADKYGKKNVFTIAAVLSLVPLVGITNLGHEPLWVVLSWVGFFFVCIGGRMIPATALVSTTVQPQQRGTFMSLVSSVQQFSSAAAAYIAGTIVTTSATGQLLDYDKVGYLAAAFTILAIFANRLIQTTEVSAPEKLPV